tara:strand:+ start:400 stop:1317 length:918 start_codon:yes stop_codon:yes gene_type:complete
MALQINEGWLNVYKPLDITSSKVVQKIKKKFNIKKIGHAGTLDPKAKGVLPIAIGDATKLMSYVVDKEKQYKFSIKWGQQTTTDDKEGKIIFFSKKIPKKEEINNSLFKFIGLVEQIPPKYSSIKYLGKRSYSLSRKGINFDLKTRKVELFSLKHLNDLKFNKSTFLANCGPGYYIRSLGRDLAIDLGTRGHIASLERLKVGIFEKKNTILLDDLLKLSHLSKEFNFFYKSAEVLDDIPALTVKNDEVLEIKMGRKINISFLSEKTFNNFHSKKFIFAKKNSDLIALGYIQGNFFRPKKVFIKEE